MLSTDKQTNQHYQKHNLLCQGGKYRPTPNPEPLLLHAMRDAGSKVRSGFPNMGKYSLTACIAVRN